MAMRKIEVTVPRLFIYLCTQQQTRFFMKVSLYFSTYRHRVFFKTREFYTKYFPYFDFFFFSDLGKRDIKVIWIQNIWILFQDIVFIIKFIWMFIWNHLNNSYYFVQFPYNQEKTKNHLFHICMTYKYIHKPTQQNETEKKYVAHFAFTERLTK